ncbi:MAG TPA: hypothetical protein VN345_05275, partial [Blastocatellia bacterium]|nr:hypothetical protein [Blastocatellia bacterium]
MSHQYLRSNKMASRIILPAGAAVVALLVGCVLAFPARPNSLASSIPAAVYQSSRSGQWLIEAEPGTS